MSFRPKSALGFLEEFLQWYRNDFCPPSPKIVKRAVLKRHGLPGAVWIETGTFHGDTTDFLAKRSEHVYTIELDKTLAENATRKFRGRNITVLQGGSEDRLGDLMPKIQGDVNFWLDGHYSGVTTAKGKLETPIREELEVIGQHLSRLGKVRVLIDDLRCFDPHSEIFRDYPSLDYLVEWSQKHGLHWSIEQDIFIAKR